MSYKLSIITINLNNAEGLSRTIKSVLSQTFTDFEYVIIDGASTDGSVDIIKQYVDKITYWVSEPDKGIYNAMNKGILKANGEYLLFLNSGDYLYSDSVLEKVFGQNESSASILTGIMQKINSDSCFIELDKGQLYKRRIAGYEKLTLYDMFYGTLNHSSSFIKRNLFEEYGLYNENYKIVSDWIFFLIAIGLNSVDVKYIDVVISCFDMTGISNRDDKLLIKERKNVITQFLPKYIIEDYYYLLDLESNYNNLRKIHDYVFHYRITFVIANFINRIIRNVRFLCFWKK
jgi:glycosyltransferase involved in cell wall biosynthesis